MLRSRELFKRCELCLTQLVDGLGTQVPNVPQLQCHHRIEMVHRLAEIILKSQLALAKLCQDHPYMSSMLLISKACQECHLNDWHKCVIVLIGISLSPRT